MDSNKKWAIFGIILGLYCLYVCAYSLPNKWQEESASFKAERFCATKYRQILTRTDEPDRMIVFMSIWEMSEGKKTFSTDEYGYLHITKETKLVTHSRDAKKVIFPKSHPQWKKLEEKIKPGFTVELIKSSPGKADKKNWVNYVDIWVSVKPTAKK